ncbi:9169_t:CDS:2 [Racocetra fulgida]|uniref:ubiquitinyl hydrolase 1 n=1 Tax=Racocetra fulgida TaxID=60492 RepID=A0A9N8Z645_9GLOM|nr:9169_t:CDS:2 [Racocetra fulgida]
MSTSSDPDNSDPAFLSIAERKKLLQNQGLFRYLKTNNGNSKTPKNNIAASKPIIPSQASTIQNSDVSTLSTSNLPSTHQTLSTNLPSTHQTLSTNLPSTHQTLSSNALIAPDNPDPITIPQRNSSLLENLPFTDRIEVNLLRDLLNETPNILVLDIRSREEFNKENCPEHEKKLFSERHTFNLVVYHGYGSELIPCATNLIQAIFENEFKKPLKRYPVFLVGGFIAWEQLTGETGVERNNPNIPNIQTNQFAIYDKAGMANFTTHESPLENILSNDLTNNQAKPKISAPNKPLPRPIPNSSVNSNDSSISKSGSSLQRRKTIFDHPYHGFSEVKNPDYNSLKRPPPPKKPLPQIPYGQQSISSVTTTNNPVPMNDKRPKFTHASESSFSQLGSGIGTTGLRNLGTKGVLADKFATLIRVMWSDQYVSISPVSLKEAVGCFAPQFSGSEQQDSQEFLAYLLDGLHEDLNINYHNFVNNDSSPQDADELENLPPSITSELAWEKHLMRNSSIVVSLFQGQFCNRLMCMTCGKTSTSYDVFMYLSLPIPTNIKSNVRVYLEMCLKGFIKEEILDGNDAWNCPRCKCPRRATKQLSISRLPDILLIHLKRFSFYGPFRDKLDTMVHFPIRRLDLTPYVFTSGDGGSQSNLSQMGPFIYDLYAVSNHYGGLNGGHYTACVRNGYRNEWHNFDDSRASICEEQDIVTRAAYNLFYVRTSI